MREVLAAYLDLHGTESRGARAELEQLEAILADAVGRLAASFERLSTLAARGSAFVAPRQAANDAPAGRYARPRTECTGGGVAGAVREAVSALQFQDLASQLLGHAVARLEALERMSRELARLPEAPATEVRAALAAVRAGRRASPVGRHSLQEGGAELFQG